MSGVILDDMEQSPFPTSQLGAALITAYMQTRYVVYAIPPFNLWVDRPSARLAALQRVCGVECSAYITACNPGSVDIGSAENELRHGRLGEELARLGLVHMEGVGEHPSGGWPGERSYLVPGLELEPARAMALRLGQNAILWSGKEAVPRLVLLR